MVFTYLQYIKQDVEVANCVRARRLIGMKYSKIIELITHYHFIICSGVHQLQRLFYGICEHIHLLYV